MARPTNANLECADVILERNHLPPHVWPDLRRDIALTIDMAERGPKPRKLTLPELSHLSALLEAERESGSYYGKREEYYARTERLMKWCGQQIKQIAKAETREDAGDAS